MTAPTLAELQETVARMEARLGALDDPGTRALLADYHALCLRFAADLRDPRDEALARSAALMLVQAANRRTGAS